MLHSVNISVKSQLADVVGQNIAQKIKAALSLPVSSVNIVKSYVIEGLAFAEIQSAIGQAAIHDPVLQDASLDPFSFAADWILEVAFRPGVTDNEARTARDTLSLVLGRERDFAVYTRVQYHLKADLSLEEVNSIAKDLLANELIQRYEIKNSSQWQSTPGFNISTAKVSGQHNSEVVFIPLETMSDAELMEFSRANTLALSLEEMTAIKAEFARPEIQEIRQKMNLTASPTDAEIEVLAQTWSEHCKHKIFSAEIDYLNKETGQRSQVNSLYKSCIQAATATLRKNLGSKDYCRSVFKDNAGVVAFDESHDLCIKVETHNSPSALDPYGGALTGIVGVNRDPMGTGIGAELLCNTDVFCFASPFHEKELLPRLLHPRRVMEGVREGVEHGGNKSGIPTVNGSVVFDERYLGKPLVYCGTVGLLPRRIADSEGVINPGHYKKAHCGDIIVMAGGRIGKDGIHGATFSSEELHQESPATAVQIGDPITQRKLYDFIIKARNLGLYSAITDNGAGGLSSSVGEMAEDTGGCRMDLAKAPLKYEGLRPWEILLSEAQERMTLAVPPANLSRFLALAEEMDVEATALGEFTDSGYFHVEFENKPVVYLPMSFMHEGTPKMHLAAVWERPKAYPEGAVSLSSSPAEAGTPEGLISRTAEALGYNNNSLLLSMLKRLNICSKEYLIRQYDHEVKGGSVIKPMVGEKRDGPGDAAVLRPLLDSERGIVLSHGICPKFSDADTYWMMANAIDEAIRNAVAVGADPEQLAGVDNFCWCDPVESEKTPDGQYKLAQLVRACNALLHFCQGFGVPCVSGKDSMKNDYSGGGVKISIPPTVLFSVLGIVPDVKLAVSSDFKKSGDRIYLLGYTHNELAGSELASELKLGGGAVPHVDLLNALERYRLVHKAMQAGLISACHDLSDGGLGVALAEMSIGGRLGADVDLELVPALGFNKASVNTTISPLSSLLYSESASRLLVTVHQDAAAAFEHLFAGKIGYDCALLGRVSSAPFLTVKCGTSQIIELPVEELATAFKLTLDW